MKKILFVLMVITVPFLFPSCEQEEIILPSSDFFIVFEGTQANISKNSPTPLRIPVYVAAEAGEPIYVTIQPNQENSTAVDDIDYQLIGGSQVYFPIGAGYDTLLVQPLPGGTPGNLTLELMLVSNTANYKMGFFYGEHADSTSHDRFLITFIE